jgi:geranyl-CoA carboxylase alpha subunit
MIRKVLIANRGEIACRIVRTCQEMGIATVAVYSDADVQALHVEMADEAVHIGGAKALESYLDGDTIIQAAKRVGAQAIHPGYGFLAENATFAYNVKANDLIFIGPPPEAIEAMGDKRIAKLILQDVPFIPGYTGDDQRDETLISAANDIGYPVMIKATAGGGGKGMRLVEHQEDMKDAIGAAKREAQQAFGNDMLMLEKALIHPRHIEIQLFGDQYGNLVTLGERECSIQRRHQKIIEETPSTALTSALRRQMCDVALNIGEQLGYYNAGTIEFLLDTDGNFYFMEMNTRLQVEHPVTEEVYAVDLVRWQLEVARGNNLNTLLPPGMDLDDVGDHPYGHAIEVRIYAEDPQNQFLPSTGEVLLWQAPSNVRVDSGIRTGDAITPYYDPMVAKIISHASTRLAAIRKLDYALSQTALHGVKHNIAFLREVLFNTDHLGGIISTQFLEENNIDHDTDPFDVQCFIAVCMAKSGLAEGAWRNNRHHPIRYTFKRRDEVYTLYITPTNDAGQYYVQFGDDSFDVRVIESKLPQLTIAIDGHQQKYVVSHNEATNTWWAQSATTLQQFVWQNPLPAPNQTTSTEGGLLAPMPGQVIQFLVEEGSEVEQGQALMILEAMKMEHRIDAPYAGTLVKFNYSVGDNVQADAILLELQPKETHD